MVVVVFNLLVLCLEMCSGVREAGFELFQLEVQLHAAVELGFLARTGAEAGHLAGEAFVLSQGGAAALGGSGIRGGREAAGQASGGVSLEAFQPALVERVEILWAAESPGGAS